MLKKLAKSRHVSQLVQLHTEHSSAFDAAALGSLWGRVAQLTEGKHGASERRWMQHHADSLAPLRRHTVSALPQFEAQHLSQASAGAAACCAALRRDAAAEWSAFWEPFSEAARATLAHPTKSRAWSPHELTTTAVAISHGSICAPLLLDHLGAAAAPRLRDFSAAELSQAARAFARTEPRGARGSTRASASASASIFDGLAHEATARVGEFSGAELVITADAFARVKRSKGASAVLAAIAPRARSELGSLSADELSQLAWAYAASNHLAPKLLGPLAGAAAERAADFSARPLATLLWALAALGESAPQRRTLFQAAAEAAAALLRDAHGSPHGFTAQGLSTLGWAYAVADPQAGQLEALFGGEGLFAARCGEALLGEGAPPAQPRQLTQLHQWALWREERGAQGAQWPPLAPALRKRCHAAFVKQRPQPSAWQLAVTAQLEALGYSPVHQEVITEQGYLLDVQFTHAGQRIALEVDGPSHFVGRSSKLTGATQLKRRQLAHFGSRLVSLPYQTAQVAARSDGASQQRLRDSLMEAIVTAVGEDAPADARRGARRAVSVRAVEHCRARFKAFYGGVMD